MTTYLKAHKGVETEVRERIEAIAPNEQSRYRFRFYPPAAAASRGLETFTGTPRVFDLGAAKKLNGIAACAQSYREMRTMDLRIIYPVDNFKGADWSAISVDDYNLIRADLVNNATSTAGVAYRIVQPAGEVTSVKYSDDPWRLVTIPLEIYFDVTTS